MKTQEWVKENYKMQTLDGRDCSRLIDFFPSEDWELFGFKITEGATHEPKPWTEEAILEQLKDDVAFGFEKALNQRGLSAGMMYNVVQMWNLILDDGLEDFDNYAQYGLPLFKATALKYGFENPIGDDNGDESKYASD